MPRHSRSRAKASPSAQGTNDLLPRLTALEASLSKLVGTRGAEAAPASLVLLVRQVLFRARSALPSGVSLPRLRGDRPVSQAELIVCVGQARAALASEANTPEAARRGTDIAALRLRLAQRIDRLSGKGPDQA